ncbi:hypothetical protein KM043_016471 [Ampulex compressa]|nr:hypothetical protein KM043_016471 [Ampulex compressa]
MITLQFGQCGNQLGQCLFSKVFNDIEHKDIKISYDIDNKYKEDASTKWFKCTKSPLARAILIDTEGKVIDKISNTQTAPWSYSKSNFIYQTSGGSANNWAYGYSTKLCDATLEAIRQEVEATDAIEAFLLLFSSAGGTGSGVGSHTIQVLRDTYKTKPIICGVVLPFTSGEVCTQKYNTLLSFGSFYDEVDMAIVFQNQEIYTQGKRLWKDTQLKDLNKIIAEQLAVVFQPVSCKQWSANRLVSSIASHSLYKLVEIGSAMHRKLPHTGAISSTMLLAEMATHINSLVDHKTD